MRHESIRDLLRIEGYLPTVIFDVGANTGQSLSEFARAFPKAEIYSFEPITAAYSKLCSTAAAFGQAKCFQVAFSSTEGKARMKAHGASLGNRVLAHDDPEKRTETVVTITGDRFCREHGIERISFLKVDTEGHDLDVLKGFTDFLADHRIDYLQVECGFAPENRRHIPYEVVSSWLYPFGYRLFGIYGLARRFGNDKLPNVMFGDACYVAMN